MIYSISTNLHSVTVLQMIMHIQVCTETRVTEYCPSCSSGMTIGYEACTAVMTCNFATKGVHIDKVCSTESLHLATVINLPFPLGFMSYCCCSVSDSSTVKCGNNHSMTSVVLARHRLPARNHEQPSPAQKKAYPETHSLQVAQASRFRLPLWSCLSALCPTRCA